LAGSTRAELLDESSLERLPSGKALRCREGIATYRVVPCLGCSTERHSGETDAHVIIREIQDSKLLFGLKDPSLKVLTLLAEKEARGSEASGMADAMGVWAEHGAQSCSWIGWR
jgi:hypothetical protein